MSKQKHLPKSSLGKEEYKKNLQVLERKLEQLRSENFQLKQLIDDLPGDIYWKNTQGVWVGLNKRCAKSLQAMGFIKEGLKSEVLGKTDYDLFTRETADEYRKNDHKVMNTKTEIAIEELTQLPSSEKVVLLSTKIPLFDINGSVDGVVGNTINITYLKNIEHALKEAINTAAAANLAKDEFLANMSHDIRTPLSGIIGISSILEKDVNTSEEKKYAHWIRMSGEQLLTLLNSVLDIVSIGNNKEEQINLEPVNIHQIIQNIIELELPTIKLKGLKLIMKVDEQVPMIVITDSVKLHRIILNLLGNAIKFTEKGHVGLLVEYNSLSQQLLFSVSDSGPGIAKKNQHKVFDRFYRGDPSHKGVYTGFGVGLHIVQQYLNLLQGKINLESQLGRGSTFKVALPVEIYKHSLKTGTHLHNNKTIDETAICSRSPLVLLVEDNMIALKVIESIVQQANCHYLSATSGTQAFELVKTHEFDLILSDIGLPGLSGNELAASIREYEIKQGKKPVPIVGITAHVGTSAKEELLKGGLNKVLSKPLTSAKLTDILQEFISLKKEASSTSASLSVDLLENEEALFELESFPLFDKDTGVSTVGSLEILKELITLMFKNELPKDILLIQEAYEQSDYDRVAKLAHKMKSSALYCGTLRLKFACQYLERYQKEEPYQLFEKLYQQLRRVIEETEAVVLRWIENA